jgi:radical SAM protein (TIGR01212 family)
MLSKPYTDYPSLLNERFAERVQKISVHAGFTCPNRDGSKGTGGCTYCNNQSFVPEYCRAQKSVSQQVGEGIAFFHHKYQAQKYLVYFQSYTNTYAPLEELKQLYEQAFVHPKVVGIVIGTRPDCVSPELLDYFAELNKRYYVMIEYGVESTCDQTLALINRGHSYAESVEAIQATAARGIPVGAHLILGLPGEDKAMILSHAKQVGKLPLTMLKLHQLQLVKGTAMAQQYLQQPENFHLYTLNEYIDLVIDFLELLPPRIAIERFVSQSPDEFLLAPKWGVKNFEFVHKLQKRFEERKTQQGKRLEING